MSGAVDVYGLGIDLAEVDRVRRVYRRNPEAFRVRCFTDHEWEYAHRYAEPYERLAARFAGKEAVMKSMGTGWRRVRWTDVEITGGGPRFRFRELSVDDFPQVERARHDNDPHQGQSHEYFVAEELGSGPDASQQRVFTLGGPATQHHTVNTQG